MAGILSLPDDLFYEIASYLDVESHQGTLRSLSLVSRQSLTPCQSILFRSIKLSPIENTGADTRFLKLLSTIPADQAYRPLSEGNCPMVR